MKYSIFAVLIAAVLAISVHGQTRPRYFDNFDTSTGVQLAKKPAADVLTVVRSPDGRPRVAPRHYLPSPGSGEQYKKLVAAGEPAPPSKVRSTADSRGRTLYDPAESRLVMKSGTQLRGFSTGDPDVDSFIVESSRRYRIDPLLIYAQMGQESSFKKRALSHKGASGLMQLMPATARRLGVKNIYDPQENIEGGVKYMRMLLNMFDGDVKLALAGYNAGEGAVMKYGNQIPPYRETRDYVARISARYNSISRRSLSDADQSANSSTLADFRRQETTRFSGSGGK